MNDRRTNPYWRLNSVELTGFRGIGEKLELDFRGRPAVLFGPNGMGKSSVTLGIHWTLYGRFPKGVLQNTKYNDFLRPVFSPKGTMSGILRFENGPDSLVVERVEKSFKVRMGEMTWSADEAAGRIVDILKIDEDTFSRTVMLQQGLVRGLLISDIAERNKAIDRLLGMEIFDELKGCLKSKEFSKAGDVLRKRMDDELRDLESNKAYLANNRNQLEDIARGKGYESGDFTSGGLQKALAEVGRISRELAGKYGVEVEDLPECNRPEQTEIVFRAVQDVFQKMRTTSAQSQKMAEAREDLVNRRSLLGEWNERQRHFKEVSDDYAETTARHGTPDRIRQEITELADKESRTEDALKAASLLCKLLGEAKQYIDREKCRNCPVCEQELPQDCEHKLAQRIEELSSHQVKDLEEQIRKIKEEHSRLTGIEHSVLDRLEKMRYEENRIEELRKSTAGKLGSVDLTEHALVRTLEDDIRRLEGDIESFEKYYALMEADIAVVSEELDRVRTVLLPVIEIRVKQADIEGKIEEARRRNRVVMEQAEILTEYADRIDAISNSVIAAKNRLAGERLERARDDIHELYNKLVQHPLFDSLTVASDEKKGAWGTKVDYYFNVSRKGKSGSSREARLLLSDGQMTGCALALFFALAKSAEHNLGLLYVDDPTQNLDHQAKVRTAGVISEIAGDRQLIVSTQDEDFFNSLKDGGLESWQVYHFSAWNGNPTVRSGSE